jgi:hypothetical protein
LLSGRPEKFEPRSRGEEEKAICTAGFQMGKQLLGAASRGDYGRLSDREVLACLKLYDVNTAVLSAMVG